MKTLRKCRNCGTFLRRGEARPGEWYDEHDMTLCGRYLYDQEALTHVPGPDRYLQLDIGSAWLVFALSVVLGSAAGLIARGADVEPWLSLVIGGIATLLVWGAGLVILR